MSFSNFLTDCSRDSTRSGSSTALRLSIAWTSIDFIDSNGVFTPLSTKKSHCFKMLKKQSINSAMNSSSGSPSPGGEATVEDVSIEVTVVDAEEVRTAKGEVSMGVTTLEDEEQ